MINPLIKIIELFVDEEQDAILQSISVVDKPAIEREFMYFSEDGRKLMYFQEDGDQRIVVSPAMIPDKMIPRKDKDGSIYYVYFSKETIAKAAEYLMKYNKQSHSNINHQRIYSDDMYVMESWIKESDNDKSTDFGFGDLPVGTWFVKFRIMNDEAWSKIKSGELKGLSVEGDFLLGDEKYTSTKFSAVRKKYKAAYKGLTEEEADELDEILHYVEMNIDVAGLPGYVNQGETGPQDMDWEDWVDMDALLQFSETYTDYPESASNNAKKALEWRDKYPSEIQGGTQIGWTRANQLANKRPISEETIARMASFARHRQNAEVDPAKKNKPWTDAGYVAYLIWGGESGISWATRKLDSIRREGQRMEEEEMSMDFAPASGNKGDRPLARIPKEERGRTGSDTNKPGDSTTTRGGTTVPEAVEKTLKDKIAKHNEENPQDSQKATLGMLKAVWRRGSGAYSVGTPGKRGMARPQWAMARVNAFLNILAGNKSGYDKDYIQDNDLLPAGHPKSTKD